MQHVTVWDNVILLHLLRHCFGSHQLHGYSNLSVIFYTYATLYVVVIGREVESGGRTLCFRKPGNNFYCHLQTLRIVQCIHSNLENLWLNF